MKKNILSVLVLVIAEALIITAMLLIPYPIPTRIRILDMCVLSILLLMIGYDLFRPLVNLALKNPPEIGSLGIRWYGQLLYFFISIVFAVAGIVWNIPFAYQLFGQILLFAFLFLNYYFAAHAAHKITQVAQEEDNLLNGRQMMRNAITQIQDEIAISSGLPEYFRVSIDDLEEHLQYISPCGSRDAIAYEKQFVALAQKIVIEMSNFEMNEETLKKDILRLQRILDNRKNTIN